MASAAELKPDPFANGSFRLLSIAGSYGGLQYDLKPKKPASVILYQTLSDYYPRPASPQLEIYREFPPPPDSPPGTPPLRYPAVTTTLSKASKNWIVVTTPVSPKALDPMQSWAIADDPETHRSSTLKIINFSSYSMAIAIENEIYQVAPNEEKIVPLNPPKKYFLLKSAVNKNGKWKQGYEEEFRYRKDLRGFVFIANYVRDPDFDPLPMPPIVLVKTHFEIAPDAYLSRQKKEK